MTESYLHWQLISLFKLQRSDIEELLGVSLDSIKEVENQIFSFYEQEQARKPKRIDARVVKNAKSRKAFCNVEPWC